MPPEITPARLDAAYDIVRDALLAERNDCGHWTGELSTSALSTATAVMALELVRRDRPDGDGAPSAERFQSLIDGGIAWLAAHQNDDGGWGDTIKSISNISTTMLARAVFHATESEEQYRPIVDRAVSYIERVGGVQAVLTRYGKDRTFSIPILTHCALARLVDWKDVLPLPFELSCLPPKFYKTVRLPVVSYALPALIAIGQVRHHHRRPWNPLTRLLRKLAIEPSLRVLERIQPSNGGFLEAAPLTSFVTMSLAGMGLAGHPVARKGVQFLIDSVRDDGSWPIDTNLATWVTALSVNALGPDLPENARPAIRDWLLSQQYTEVHPYTNADPGGWAWTDLPGGVPDADDTPGAMLALMNLTTPQTDDLSSGGNVERARSLHHAAESTSATQTDGLPSDDHASDATALDNAVRWLLDLQNRDGGFPTFCRGWGKLPFDRSSPDITAHCLRALTRWLQETCGITPQPGIRYRVTGAPRYWLHAIEAVNNGFRFLASAQHPDGSWLPLWFGNQHGPDDENPVYGTSRVLAAYRDCGWIGSEPARRGLDWLLANQNDDGGWGGSRGITSSIEETALAAEIVFSLQPESEAAARALAWLLECVESGRFAETTPIGFYFAKLWYFERLYPMTFMVAALRAARTAFRVNEVNEATA